MGEHKIWLCVVSLLLNFVVLMFVFVKVIGKATREAKGRE